MEGFYQGLAYPFVTPAQMLLLLALGLLAGGFETERIRWFLAVFLIAMLGGIFAMTVSDAVVVALLGLAVGASALAALAPGRFHPVVLAVMAAGGFLIGAMARDPGPWLEQVAVILGTFLGANFGLLLFAVGPDLVKEQAPWSWVPIAFRVAAAWVAAIALLLLALKFAPPPAAG